MNLDHELNDALWIDRYGKFNQSIGLLNGKIVNVDGVTDKDAYNPSLCKYDDTKILAFRCEKRESQINDLVNYHPSIQFADQIGNDWKLSDNIAPFDMLEDPIFVKAQINNQNCIVFGGVRAKMKPDGKIDVNTELYKGDSLANLEREPFMIVHGMKDVHLCQLPDGRFLLCRRPIDENGIGHAVLHIVDTLEDLESINVNIPPVVIELSSPYYGDWVGINNAYILNDKNNTQWVGLLGHLGSSDENGRKHYAAITYKIKLDDLITGRITGVEPTIIATRACFEDGPQKTPVLRDVIFPGSLEKLDNGQYRLWAGLSDTRIGIIDIDNPFMFDK